MEKQAFEDLPLFSPDRTLGFYALRSNATHAHGMYELADASVSPERYDELTENIRKSKSLTMRGVGESRAALTMFTGPKEALLATYLNGIVPPIIGNSIEYKNGLRDTPLTWNQWIADHATDDELLSLLLEHNSVMMQHATSEGIAEDIQTLQQNFMFARDHAQKIGFFGKELDDPSEVTVSFGDIFDTYLKDMGGYYLSPKKDIVIGQGHKGNKATHVDEARKSLPRILTHEWVHALVGKSLKDITSPLANRWINEAETEIISRSIRESSGETIVEDNTYIDERKLLDDLLAPAKDPIVIRNVLTRAFSGSDSDRDSFVQVVDQLWNTRDVIEKVSEAIKFEENRLAKGKAIDRMTEITAIQKVRAAFKKDSNSILLRGVDEMIADLPIAAQES